MMSHVELQIAFMYIFTESKEEKHKLGLNFTFSIFFSTSDQPFAWGDVIMGRLKGQIGYVDGLRSIFFWSFRNGSEAQP